MNPTILLQQLQHGETYSAVNEAGDTYQVTRPPTRQSLAAARIIQQLAQQNEQLGVVVNQLQKDLQDAYDQINNLSAKPASTSDVCGNAAATNPETSETKQ